MTSNNHIVDEVLQDNSLIATLVAKDSVIARRYAKGIVLCQQIGFSKGSYANLKQLKYFYSQLNKGQSPSYSLIIRRALDLLNEKISRIKTHTEFFEEQHVFSILTSIGKRSHREF